MLDALRSLWEGLQERLFFLPPFPDRADPLALFSLLMVSGLIFGELLHRRLNLPRIVGYVLAGTLFGPSLFGWITVESLTVARPLADTALGLLLLEIGRRMDLRWLRRNPALLRTAAAEASLSFFAIFAFATLLAGLSPAWAGAAAAITMASAPAVVLLTAEETRAQGQVAQRTVLLTSLNCAASFVVFTIVLGLIHGEHSEDWLNAVVHPLWVSLGALGVGTLAAGLCLLIARNLPKGSLAQVFVLVAVALLAVGIARMIVVPVFLSLFLMGAAVAYFDRDKTLAYTDLPQGLWLLAIVLFVIAGATLPWREFTLITGLQALGLLAVRAAAKVLAVLDGGQFRPGPAQKPAGRARHPAPFGDGDIHDRRAGEPLPGGRPPGAGAAAVRRRADGVRRAYHVQAGLRQGGRDRQGAATTRRHRMIEHGIAFSASAPLSLGVELELQLISSRDYDLTRAASDLLAGLKHDGEHGDVKLEITESMIEINTLPRAGIGAILTDLHALREVLVAHCGHNNISVCGGGAHPFHRWPERRICPGERFEKLSERYGYLAKQFTVFGQHIHIGCESGDQAIWLTHALHRYVPHFIALSAASPFQDSTDTLFESSRSNAVSAFPLSGQAPALMNWQEFEEYFDMLRACDVAQSIKDLYWDIRPKPEFGTVEIRVCDTPLTVERAAALAAFAQSLASHLLRVRPEIDPQRQSHVARYNKFQACRYGFDAMLADPVARSCTGLREDLLATLAAVAEDAHRLGCAGQIAALNEAARDSLNGARWLRTEYRRLENHNDVVRSAAALFAHADDPLSP